VNLWAIVVTLIVYFILMSLEAECQKSFGENQTVYPKLLQTKYLHGYSSNALRVSISAERCKVEHISVKMFQRS
jgi:hypothetical protein